jgi:hypothetical protein
MPVTRNSIVFVLCAFLVFLWGCTKSESPSPQKGQQVKAQGAEQTSNAKQEIYCFRRKGKAARGANNKALEGIKLLEGNITGLIVQKGEIKESQSKDNPSKKSYAVSYELTNGSEIAAIDEEGVHQDGDKILSLTVSQEGTPPDDNEVLESGMNVSEQAMMPPIIMVRTPAGGMVVRISGKSETRQRTSANVLLGEYRLDPETKKARIIPALEVKTVSGVITIPVQNILTFKQKANE